MNRLDTAPSATLIAIRQTAVELGLADPQPIADDLIGVDVDALHEWFTVAARTRVCLWQGAGRLVDALPMLAGGWSSPAPSIAIGEQQRAGLASRDVVGAQVDAADATVATLRQSRVLATCALADAAAAIHATGWPPGEDLLRWASRAAQVAGDLRHGLRALSSTGGAVLAQRGRTADAGIGAAGRSAGPGGTASRPLKGRPPAPLMRSHRPPVHRTPLPRPAGLAARGSTAPTWTNLPRTCSPPISPPW